MNPAVIFDNGSGLFKAGLGDDDSPRVMFPTIIGKPKNPSLMVGMDQKDSYVGKEADEKRPLLYISNPIQHGHIMDWEAMEKIWSHTYENELVVDATEHPIMLTEPPANAKADRVKLMQTFFETYNVNHFNLSVGNYFSNFPIKPKIQALCLPYTRPAGPQELWWTLVTA
jgi:actin